MTKTTTVTIAEFLLARIAEDEAAARTRSAILDALPAHERAAAEAVRASLLGGKSWGISTFAPDPARVLSECEAKRRIVGLHKDPERVVEDPDAPEGLALVPGGSCLECHHATHPCPTLRALASVYADHPDYDPSWA